MKTNKSSLQFAYKNNVLHWGSKSLNDIAQSFGTPSYIYNFDVLRHNLTVMAQAFNGIPHLLCYALKANSNLLLLDLIASSGYGAEVVSRGELTLALKSGFPANNIIFTGVGKTSDELEYAIKTGIMLINVESYQEIELVNKIAKKLKTKQNTAIRINPDVPIETHPYIATGHHESKFGVDFSDFTAIINRIKKLSYICLTGIHLHLGSQIMDLAPLREGIKHIEKLLTLCRQKNVQIHYVDLGGGLGYNYEYDHVHESAHPFKKTQGITPYAWAQCIKDSLPSFSGTIIVEPGRWLTASTGILLTRILYTKHMNKKSFAVVDAGMNDLLRPALYNAFHSIVPVTKHFGSKKKWDVVGPICETGDFLAHDRILPDLYPQDLLAIFDTGAYGYVLSSQYNSRLRGPEIAIEKNSVKILRERESIDDLTVNIIHSTPQEKSLWKFWKYSGSGNDFLILETPLPEFDTTKQKQLFQRMCHRRFGIGADGIVIVNQKSKQWNATFYNSDGCPVSMCGNGLRCAAYHIVCHQNSKNNFSIRTERGLHSVSIQDSEVSIEVQVFGKPRTITVPLGRKEYSGWLVDTGVPHFVHVSNRISDTGFVPIARRLRHHSKFAPEGANVSFIKPVDNHTVAGKIFERGVEDETYSSGTGASAIAIIAVNFLHLTWPVNVQMKGGTFSVSERTDKKTLWLNGTVNEICQGNFNNEVLNQDSV